MSNRLEGKVAVVTGSGQGIGKAIAIALAREGASVVTNNRKKGSTGLTTYNEAFDKSMSKEEKERAAEMSGDAETTAAEIIKMGGKAVPFFGDVSNFEVAGKLIQTAVDNFGKIDIVVNNAGTFAHAWPWEMTEEEWDHVTSSKPKSFFNTTRNALPLMMKQRWGRIINCTSSAWLGQSNHANYSAANAGVVGFTRSVARDVFEHGITCNAFAPGALTRATWSMRILLDRQAAGRGVTPTSPRGEMALPEHVAPFIAYLATEEAGNITGTVFAVHGGHIGRYLDPVEVATLDKQEGLWTVDELVEQVPKILLAGYRSPAARSTR
jgi:3-oxoacyl-[acyl-carrier protein] reductase